MFLKMVLLRHLKAHSHLPGPRPLPQQLDGLLPEPASSVRAEGLASSANIEALEKQHNQEITDQLEKEKQEYKQKLAK